MLPQLSAVDGEQKPPSPQSVSMRQLPFMHVFAAARPCGVSAPHSHATPAQSVSAKH
jgi:hypothetical protein